MESQASHFLLDTLITRYGFEQIELQKYFQFISNEEYSKKFISILLNLEIIYFEDLDFIHIMRNKILITLETFKREPNIDTQIVKDFVLKEKQDFVFV